MILGGWGKEEVKVERVGGLKGEIRLGGEEGIIGEKEKG